jgi:hypothetical protein
VYSNIYPAKSEAPFKIIFGLSIVSFIVTSIICYVLGYVLNSSNLEEALLTAEFFKIFAYGLVSMPLIAMAYMIAKKV